MDAAIGPDSQSDCLTAALDYASRGLRVLPIAPGKKIPCNTNGCTGASCIADVVRKWYDRTPNAGVGIAGGGPARLVIIDVDEEIGAISFGVLQRSLGPLPATASVRTRRGRHLYFRVPAAVDMDSIRNSTGDIAPKVDIRATGGYVVAPPTPGYSWDTDDEIAELPIAWANRLKSLSSNKYSSSAYAKKAILGELDKVINEPEGSRNDQLNRSAFALGQLVASGHLAREVVRAMLIECAVRHAGQSQREAESTVDSGMASGGKTPRRPNDRSQVTTENGVVDLNPLLLYTQGGGLSKDPNNATVILSLAPEWRGCFGWDQFAGRAVWTAPPKDYGGIPWPADVGDYVQDHHVTWVQFALGIEYRVQFSAQAVLDGIHTAAHDNGFHPLRDYLTRLEWDGSERVDGWLSTYLDADDSDYVANVGRWWLVSCVARALRPGCQVDHMLVLEGDQGAGKSSAVRILGGDYYLGSLPDFRDRKAAAESLAGRWIVEVGELDALRGSAATRVKDFLSQTVDHFRPAYGRLAITRPRECVFVGTTNEGAYLSDPTGGRRFWPVRVGRLYREDLLRNRDQLWAEAVHLYRTGTQWWPDQSHTPLISEQQESRFQVDDWEPTVASWCRAQPEFTIGEVLSDALKIDIGKWDRTAQTRVGAILHRLGYGSRQVRRDGVRVRLYSATASK